MSWKVKSSKEIYKSKWMTITEDKVVTDYGDDLTYSVVKKGPFVIVIPWDGDKFTLVGLYRYAVDDFDWEFPEGFTEGMTSKEAAVKELEEETGEKAEEWNEIGNYYLSPGYCDQVGYVFLATKLKSGQVTHSGAEKGMQIKKVTTKGFEEMVRKGEIKDGPTLSAYSLLNLSDKR